MLDRLDLTRPQGLWARALRLLGFAGAFRRAELVGLNLEHLRLMHDAADEVLVITRPRSKTNQPARPSSRLSSTPTTRPTAPSRPTRCEWPCSAAAPKPLFMSLKRSRLGQPGTPIEKRLADQRVKLLVKEHLGALFGPLTARDLYHYGAASRTE